MDNINVLLVDDEPLLLDSLEIILTINNMTIAGKAHDGNEALEILKGCEVAGNGCDIALVDLNMKGMGGIELIPHIKAEFPGVKILVLTTFYDDKNITAAISGGADGYLLKDSGANAILGAVEQIMNGQNVIDNKVMQRLAAIMAKNSENVAKEEEMLNLPADITERESEVCTLLAKGYTNRQIADALYISEGTVKNYISSIYDKTGIHDRAKLIVAIRE
ncbi:MAG: response regulator transcription factor [Lachnospira sp.]|nr:response regulator transcription factor [Lachnospira sp.]